VPSAQSKPDCDDAETNDHRIEYPKREIVAARVAIIIQGQFLNQQDEKTPNDRDEYPQEEHFSGECQGFLCSPKEPLGSIYGYS
jgi:hypothetical protein